MKFVFMFRKLTKYLKYSFAFYAGTLNLFEIILMIRSYVYLKFLHGWLILIGTKESYFVFPLRQHASHLDFLCHYSFDVPNGVVLLCCIYTLCLEQKILDVISHHLIELKKIIGQKRKFMLSKC